MGKRLDNWDASLAEGLSAEAAIARTMHHFYGVVSKDNTKENKKNPDLLCISMKDTKILRSAYPSATTPAGLKAAEHLTLDYSNIMDEFQDEAEIFMVVDYTSQGYPTKGIYKLGVERIRDIIREKPERVYSRSARYALDKQKKIAISTRECGREALPGMTMAESADYIFEQQRRLPPEERIPEDIN